MMVLGETFLFKTVLGQGGRVEADGSCDEEFYVGRSQMQTLAEQNDTGCRPTVVSHSQGQSVCRLQLVRRNYTIFVLRIHPRKV